MLSLTPNALVSRQQLASFPVPTSLPNWEDGKQPLQSNWAPIQHGELVDTVVNNLEAQGYEVLQEMYTIFRKGMGLIGSIEVKTPEHVSLRPSGGINPCFVFKHTNDAHFALSFMIAGRVSVCANGCVFGDVFAKVKRKHSALHSVMDRVLEGIKMFGSQLESAASHLSLFENAGIGKQEGNDLIMQAGHAGIIPAKLVLKTSKEWLEPRHPEFKPRNAWSLYNAFTEVCKERPAHLQLATCDKAKDLIIDHITPEPSPEPQVEIIQPGWYKPNPNARIILA